MYHARANGDERDLRICPVGVGVTFTTRCQKRLATSALELKMFQFPNLPRACSINVTMRTSQRTCVAHRLFNIHNESINAVKNKKCKIKSWIVTGYRVQKKILPRQFRRP